MTCLLRAGIGAKKKRCTIQRRHHEPFIPETLLREFKVLDELFVDAKIDHYSQVQKLPPDKTEARSAINDAAQRCIAAIRQRLSETLMV
jgi:hypothetical protein